MPPGRGEGCHGVDRYAQSVGEKTQTQTKTEGAAAGQKFTTATNDWAGREKNSDFRFEKAVFAQLDPKLLPFIWKTLLTTAPAGFDLA